MRRRHPFTKPSRSDDRGAAVAVEAAVILPALVAFVGLVMLLAQLALGQQAVDAAASQAARSASLERTVAAARLAADEAAATALRDSNVECQDRGVVVNATGIAAPIGAHAEVRVTITCRIATVLAFPGFPASRTVAATATSPIDTYRGR